MVRRVIDPLWLFAESRLCLGDQEDSYGDSIGHGISRFINISKQFLDTTLLP